MNASKPIYQNAQLFQFPEQGQLVEENPPYFCWKAEDKPNTYRLCVKNSAGELVWEYSTQRTFAIMPTTLPHGAYAWNLFIENDEMGWVDFNIAEYAVEFIRPTAAEIFDKVPTVHPRQLFFAEDIANIKQNKAAELEVLKRNITQALADGLPDAPVHHMPGHENDVIDYRAFFGRYRDFCDRNLVACALGHALLNDTAAAAHGRTLLLTICNWNPSGPCSINGPWGDEIGLSNCRCLATAYDLLWDVLTEKERLFVQRTLYIYGVQCKENLEEKNFFQTPGHSHSGRVPAYLGEIAMMLKDSPVADQTELEGWLQMSLDIYGSFFPYYGGQDGGWAESVFYASTYTKWYLPFLMAIERLSGYRYLDRPFYQRVSQFFTHFSPIGWESHPFGDGYWCNSEDKEWPGFFAQNPYRFYAERFGPAITREWSRNLPLPEIFRLHLLDIFIPEGSAPATHLTGEAENTYHFKTAGVLSHHTSITTPSQDIALLARASKFGSVSHQHADQGGFAIICDGNTLVGPSGYFGYQYGTAHHKEWTNQTKAHNCILVDGVGQDSYSYAATGKIVQCEEFADGSFAATMDLGKAYPMLQRYTRHLSMDTHGEITLTDDICAAQPVQINWLLHSLSAPSICGNDTQIARGGKLLTVQPQSGIAGAPQISDQFDPPIFSDMAQKQAAPWFDLPDQYHMQWQTDKKAQHKIVVKFNVQR